MDFARRERTSSEDLGPERPDALGLEPLPPLEEFLVRDIDLTTSINCTCGKIMIMIVDPQIRARVMSCSVADRQRLLAGAKAGGPPVADDILSYDAGIEQQYWSNCLVCPPDQEENLVFSTITGATDMRGQPNADHDDTVSCTAKCCGTLLMQSSPLCEGNSIITGPPATVMQLAEDGTADIEAVAVDLYTHAADFPADKLTKLPVLKGMIPGGLDVTGPGTDTSEDAAETVEVIQAPVEDQFRLVEFATTFERLMTGKTVVVDPSCAAEATAGKPAATTGESKAD